MCSVQKFTAVNAPPHRGVRVWHTIFLYTTAGISSVSVAILCYARTTGIPSIEKFVKILLILRLLVACWCFLTLIDKKKSQQDLSTVEKLLLVLFTLFNLFESLSRYRLIP